MKLNRPLLFGKTNFLFIAFILFVIGIVAHAYKQNISIKNQSIDESYQAQLAYFNDNNLYYDPKATISWLKERQHPKGYFVENPDSMDEPSQLNRNTLQATRHAILTLYRLDGIWDINKQATIDFVYSNYRTELQNGSEIAGFESINGQPLGLRPTMDALLTLWRLNAIDSKQIDLNKVRNFILLHQNEDGGFWDPYYSTTNKTSCLRCTSFALSALSIINSRLNISESFEFKKQVVKYIHSKWNATDQTYSDASIKNQHDSFDIFRAYLSLSTLQEGAVEKRIEFAKKHFKSEAQIKTIKDHFLSSSGVFTREYGSESGSMKATHLLIWLFTDLALLEQIDESSIIKFVLSNQSSPGEYGGDIYNTYSATSILKRLDVSTKPLASPKEPQLINDLVPDYAPFILYLLSITAIIFYFLQDKKQLESKAEILKSKVNLDSLTGLYNRDYLERQFELNKDSSLSLILVDIDHFKTINDKHGHLIGDKALQKISRFISQNLRSADVLARWGGEEFAILCLNTTKKQAVELAEKLRKSIAQKDIDFIGKLTCSFGVAESDSSQSFKELFDLADKAMYASKKEGRNKVSYL